MTGKVVVKGCSEAEGEVIPLPANHYAFFPAADLATEICEDSESCQLTTQHGADSCFGAKGSISALEESQLLVFEREYDFGSDLDRPMPVFTHGYVEDSPKLDTGTLQCTCFQIYMIYFFGYFDPENIF